MKITADRTRRRERTNTYSCCSPCRWRHRHKEESDFVAAAGDPAPLSPAPCRYRAERPRDAQTRVSVSLHLLKNRAPHCPPAAHTPSASRLSDSCPVSRPLLSPPQQPERLPKTRSVPVAPLLRPSSYRPTSPREKPTSLLGLRALWSHLSSLPGLSCHLPVCLFCSVPQQATPALPQDLGTCCALSRNALPSDFHLARSPFSLNSMLTCPLPNEAPSGTLSKIAAWLSSPLHAFLSPYRRLTDALDVSC